MSAFGWFQKVRKHFLRKGHGVPLDNLLSKSTHVPSLEGTSAGCFETTQIEITKPLPYPDDEFL